MPVSPSLPPIAVAAGVLLLAALRVVLLLVKARVVVPAGSALVITRPSGRTVAFHDTLVIPLVARATLVDVSVRTVGGARARARGPRVPRRREGRRDGGVLRAGRATSEHVLKVVTTIGLERLASKAAAEELFASSFRHALATTLGQCDLDDLQRRRDQVCRHVLEMASEDLDGFVIDQVAIAHVAPVPIASLDPDDPVDARPIRVMTERAAFENANTAEMRRHELLRRVEAATEDKA